MSVCLIIPKRIVFTDAEEGQLPEFITFTLNLLRVESLTTVLGIGNQGYVYKVGQNLAYKQHGRNEEYFFMKDAGELSMKPYSRVLRLSDPDNMITDGIIMELGTPVTFENITSQQERATVKDELISLVTRLHSEKRIAHGDIKPLNFLRATDGLMRLCDWDTSLRLDSETETEEWEGGCSVQYSPPNRGWPDVKRPSSSVENDMYSLAINIWELYTGKAALLDVYEELDELLPQGRHTVDVYAIQDEEVRAWVKGILVAGGARIPEQDRIEFVWEIFTTRTTLREVVCKVLRVGFIFGS